MAQTVRPLLSTRVQRTRGTLPRKTARSQLPFLAPAWTQNMLRMPVPAPMSATTASRSNFRLSRIVFLQQECWRVEHRRAEETNINAQEDALGGKRADVWRAPGWGWGAQPLSRPTTDPRRLGYGPVYPLSPLEVTFAQLHGGGQIWTRSVHCALRENSS